MMNQVTTIRNITELYEMLGQGKPKHPLVGVADFSERDFNESEGLKYSTHFYTVMVKKLDKGSIKYGRSYYDFQEGSLFFTAPHQVVTIQNAECSNGWALFFHPDLIHGTPLDKAMSSYSFFNYDVNEALHLSDDEKEKLTRIVADIRSETEWPIDKHSKSVIVSAIALLLNHSMRYYDRQFITRSASNRDVVVNFKSFLSSYIQSEALQEKGQPTVVVCAENMHLSPNYLSDLLKRETGLSTQEHIHYCILEEAKSRLLSTGDSVNTIAYSLGFEYPQYFSKLFKKKEGITPTTFRNLN